MMNSAPAVVGASDGLAAFMSIIAKKGTRSCLGAGCGAAFQRACSLRIMPLGATASDRAWWQTSSNEQPFLRVRFSRRFHAYALARTDPKTNVPHAPQRSQATGAAARGPVVARAQDANFEEQ